MRALETGNDGLWFPHAVFLDHPIEQSEANQNEAWKSFGKKVGLKGHCAMELNWTATPVQMAERAAHIYLTCDTIKGRRNEVKRELGGEGKDLSNTVLRGFIRGAIIDTGEIPYVDSVSAQSIEFATHVAHGKKNDTIQEAMSVSTKHAFSKIAASAMYEFGAANRPHMVRIALQGGLDLGT